MGGKAALLVALLAVSLVLEIQADTDYGGGYTSTPTPITPSGSGGHHKPPRGHRPPRGSHGRRPPGPTPPTPTPPPPTYTPTPAPSPTTTEPAADEDPGVQDDFVGVQVSRPSATSSANEPELTSTPTPITLSGRHHKPPRGRRPPRSSHGRRPPAPTPPTPTPPPPPAEPSPPTYIPTPAPSPTITEPAADEDPGVEDDFVGVQVSRPSATSSANEPELPSTPTPITLSGGHHKPPRGHMPPRGSHGHRPPAPTPPTPTPPPAEPSPPTYTPTPAPSPTTTEPVADEEPGVQDDFVGEQVSRPGATSPAANEPELPSTPTPAPSPTTTEPAADEEPGVQVSGRPSSTSPANEPELLSTPTGRALKPEF